MTWASFKSSTQYKFRRSVRLQIPRSFTLSVSNHVQSSRVKSFRELNHSSQPDMLLVQETVVRNWMWRLIYVCKYHSRSAGLFWPAGQAKSSLLSMKNKIILWENFSEKKKKKQSWIYFGVDQLENPAAQTNQDTWGESLLMLCNESDHQNLTYGFGFNNNSFDQML